MAQPTAIFLERNFKVFVAVPVFATVFCIGALVGWRVTHPLPADPVVAVAETPAPVPPSELISAPAATHAESDLATADVSRSDERPERPPAPPESEAPAPAAPASVAPGEPVAPPPPAVKKADPAYEDPYVVPKNKPFIDSKTFQSGQPSQPNDKPKVAPPKPAAKPETPKTQKPANKAPANAPLKTVVLKNGRRIDVVSIAETNGTYVVENQFGATESFAKSEVSMILKR